ncbi:hypothetical protein [Nocardioides sp.]
MPWDHVTSLRTGEVAPDGGNLRLDCRDRVWDWLADAVDAVFADFVDIVR